LRPERVDAQAAGTPSDDHMGIVASAIDDGTPDGAGMSSRRSAGLSVFAGQDRALMPSVGRPVARLPGQRRGRA